MWNTEKICQVDGAVGVVIVNKVNLPTDFLQNGNKI